MSFQQYDPRALIFILQESVRCTPRRHVLNIQIALVSLALTLLELLAYFKGSPFRQTAAYIWFVLVAITVSVILTQVTRTLFELRQGRYLALLAVILLLLVIPIPLHRVDWEGAFQVQEGLLKLEEPSKGYTAAGFLGYPARQYVLVALPSLFFGRHYWSFHLGFALPFLLGTLLFYTGLIRGGVRSPLALIALLLVLTSEHIVSSYLRFEQLILPPALTLLLIGELLHHYVSPTTLTTLAATTITLILATSYTPSLATVSLVSATLLVCSVKRPPFAPSRTATLTLLLLIATHATLATAFNSNLVVSLHQPDRGPLLSSEALLRAGSALRHILLPLSTMPLLPLPLIIAWGWYLYRTVRQPNLVRVAISLWSLGVIALSATLRGHSLFPIEIEINRAMVTVPVLAAAVVWELRSRRTGEKTLFLISAALTLHLALLAGRHTPLQDLRSALVDDLQVATKDGDTPLPLRLFTRDIVNVNDFIPYFFPHLILEPDHATLSDESCPASLSSLTRGIWYFEHGVCDHLFLSGDTHRMIEMTEVMHLRRVLVPQ